MKFKLFYIIVVLFLNYSFSQESYNLRKIDSLKQVVLNGKEQDSVASAEAHYVIAEYYRKATPLADSAFYYYHKAEKIFKKLNAHYQLALTLYGVAVIQKNEKDFIGSEVSSIEALGLLETMPSSDEVLNLRSFVYNNLGIVFKELEQYDESVKYHIKAIELKEKLKGDNKKTINISRINLGSTYKNAELFDLAINYYKQILSDKEFIKAEPRIYALVLDNYAHSLYLSKKESQLPGLYHKALKISDSVDFRGYNSIVINQHLAEFYNDKGHKDLAKYYAYMAKDISEKYHNDDLLKSLLLLSKIEDGVLAVEHLNSYIQLNDSLQKNERSIRNKFARIRFETNQIEQENIQISKERMWFLVISIVVIIASFLVYLVIAQRNRNKELQFIQEQQETNEEIYNLMLSQNEKIEEARTFEKTRISEELHDGVLGRLFGTRLSLDSLNMSSTEEAIKTRSQYISELKTIEEDIRKVSHELNTDFVSGSGFVDIIKTLVETQSTIYDLSYKIDHDDIINWDGVSNKKKIHIYRIIQESLHNIYKHANASHVKVSFELKNNVIWLQLTDDGAGFNVDKAKSGIGLKNMNSRIKEINGIIDITSQKDSGTTVTIQVPIT
ncbi:sensor histidine kinase [Mariniflexile sp. AS56]|uniref:tetratricopeptide repeat-containing sensor histidine kinase n=1 Tax=Mariniflexile sp. AS56 TaxID=3063957 RepID=UPI0026EC37E0|nr:sensor histidine kinase [Mariniflexile sp. AS56]MDO7170890.1 sensor histidine kinase [Mariniflexile sp. AS56]